jgi:hypothetical protein
MPSWDSCGNEDLSGYRIRKIFEETAMGNYSSSPGFDISGIEKVAAFRIGDEERGVGKIIIPSDKPGDFSSLKPG